MARYKSKLHSTKISTLIGRDTVLMGDLSFTGGLHVEGRVVGNVNADPDSDSALVLSERGQIEGEIRVPYVMLNGAVTGDVVVAKHLELASRCHVQGNVYYSRIEMAMGAQVNGTLVHEEATNPAAEQVEDPAVGPVDTGPGGIRLEEPREGVDGGN